MTITKTIISEKEGFLYSDHQSENVFVTEYEDEDLYCETCGDSDYLIGHFTSQTEIRYAMIEFYLQNNPQKTELENFTDAAKLVDKYYSFSEL